MGIEFTESFSGTSGDTVEAYSADWSKLSGTTNGVISDAGRMRLNGTTQYVNAFSPSSANYDFEGDASCLTDGTAFRTGVIARAIDADNYFYLRYAGSTTGWQLFRRVAGTATQMGSTYAGAIGAGNTARPRLRCDGDQISAYLGSTLIIGPITYGAALTAAGNCGIYNASSSSVTNTTGVHMDNLVLTTLGGGSPAESGGSSSIVAVTAIGEGDVAASGGSSSIVAVVAVGAGTAGGEASGGSSSIVAVVATGSGVAAQFASGGSSSAVEVVAVGVGVAAQFASGGSGSVVEVVAVGAGTKYESGAYQGGSSSLIAVLAEGAGTIHVSGGSSSIVKVRAFGIAVAPTTSSVPRTTYRSVKKRAIPQPNAQQVDINRAVKERLEVICGERGTSISALPPGATIEQVVDKINELLALLQ